MLNCKINSKFYFFRYQILKSFFEIDSNFQIKNFQLQMLLYINSLSAVGYYTVLCEFDLFSPGPQGGYLVA